MRWWDGCGPKTRPRGRPGPRVRLVDLDPEGEDKVIAAMCYPHSALSEEEVLRRVRCSRADGPAWRSCGPTWVSASNRRHRPGRAFERTDYRFDVVSDYGAFRDLQRHRMLTIEWQGLTPYLGYDDARPVVSEAGRSKEFESSLERSAGLYSALSKMSSSEAAYAVALAFRIRYVMQMNAREAMHLIELRSGPRAIPPTGTSRKRCTGSSLSTPGTGSSPTAMSFVDLQEHGLERLDAERLAEAATSFGAELTKSTAD